MVKDVVPWIDRHLSTVADSGGRALEGLCAGGFGAIDIGLRHPDVFSTLSSWEGYFAPVFRDGPFVHASAADLAAHDPQQLVRQEAASLHSDGTRFFIAYGGNHAQVFGAWSTQFATELRSLGIPESVLQIPRAEHNHLWGASLGPALAYAAAGFAAREL